MNVTLQIHVPSHLLDERIGVGIGMLQSVLWHRRIVGVPDPSWLRETNIIFLPSFCQTKRETRNGNGKWVGVPEGVLKRVRPPSVSIVSGTVLWPDVTRVCGAIDWI